MPFGPDGYWLEKVPDTPTQRGLQLLYRDTGVNTEKQTISLIANAALEAFRFPLTRDPNSVCRIIPVEAMQNPSMTPHKIALCLLIGLKYSSHLNRHSKIVFWVSDSEILNSKEHLVCFAESGSKVLLEVFDSTISSYKGCAEGGVTRYNIKEWNHENDAEINEVRRYIILLYHCPSQAIN
jgi:hypothetical protein